jgi:hypothetical protein
MMTAQKRRNAAHLFETELIACTTRANLKIRATNSNLPVQGWDAMNEPAAPHVLQRIRAEYLEMPGLTLRPEQVQRLCGVDRTLCQAVLETLVETGFLSMRSDGAYARYTNSEISRARPAKASLEPSVTATLSRVRSTAS